MFDPEILSQIAHALGELGLKKAWVVHGEGGLDEVSISGETRVAQWDGARVEEFTITPEDAGLKRAPLHEIRGGDATKNARLLRGILSGVISGPMLDVSLLNAGAALVVAGKADDVREGVGIAREAIDSGKANEVLNAYLGYHH